MKKKKRNILILSGIGLFLIMGLIFYFSVLQTQFTVPGLYILTPDIPIQNYKPEQIYVNEGWTAGSTSIIKTEKSVFKFITSKTDRYTSSRSNTAIITYSVDIYKDNILIDTINNIPDHMTIPINTPCIDSKGYGKELGATYGPNPTKQIYYRTYSDDNQIYKGDEITPRLFCGATQTFLPEDVTGINVVFGYFSSIGDHLHGGHVYVIHKINIIGETDTLPTTGFSNVNGISIFEDNDLPFDVSKHSTIKITNILPDEEEIIYENISLLYEEENNTEEETVTKTIECIDNKGCIKICENQIPTCINNICHCDNIPVEVVVEKETNIFKYIISLIIIIFIVAMIIIFTKKRNKNEKKK